MTEADNQSELTALLGHGTTFEGKLFFEGNLRIDGTFRGTIYSEGVLVLGEGARVDAEIDVGTVIVRGGSCRGNMRASQSIELYVPAQVTGDLVAPEIFMDRGVRFSGSCTIDTKDLPPRTAEQPTPQSVRAELSSRD